MNAIGQSVYDQKLIFKACQPQFLKLANSEVGRHLLKKLGAHTDFPIINIGRNHVIEDTLERKNGKMILRGTFFSHQPITDILLPVIAKMHIYKREYDPFANFHEMAEFFTGLKENKRLRPVDLDWGFNPFLNHRGLRFLSGQFNPAAGSSSPVDGFAGREGVNESFASIQGGSGNAFSNSITAGAGDAGQWLQSSSTSNQYQSMRRGFTLFDTSSLTALAVISDVSLDLYIWTNYNGLGSLDLKIVGATPAATNTLANGDYAQTGSTAFATVARAGINLNAYNVYSLDSNGIANVSKTGVSKFATRTSWDFANSFGGVWSGSDNSRIDYNQADDGSNKPRLTVTYTFPSDAGQAIFWM